MPFATYEDVAVRLGRDLTAAEQETATAALADAEAAVVVYTGQTFELGPHTEKIVSATGTVRLAQRPVTAVTAYRIADVAQNLDSLTVSGNVVSGLPIGVAVELDYTAGYATVPDAVKAVVVRAALRQLVNPQGLAGYTLGGYSAQFERGTGLLTEDDRAILNRYRFRARTVFQRP